MARYRLLITNTKASGALQIDLVAEQRTFTFLTGKPRYDATGGKISDEVEINDDELEALKREIDDHVVCTPPRTVSGKAFPPVIYRKSKAPSQNRAVHPLKNYLSIKRQ